MNGHCSAPAARDAATDRLHRTVARPGIAAEDGEAFAVRLRPQTASSSPTESKHVLIVSHAMQTLLKRAEA